MSKFSNDNGNRTEFQLQWKFADIRHDIGSIENVQQKDMQHIEICFKPFNGKQIMRT